MYKYSDIPTEVIRFENEHDFFLENSFLGQINSGQPYGFSEKEKIIAQLCVVLVDKYQYPMSVVKPSHGDHKADLIIKNYQGQSIVLFLVSEYEEYEMKKIEKIKKLFHLARNGKNIKYLCHYTHSYTKNGFKKEIDIIDYQKYQNYKTWLMKEEFVDKFFLLNQIVLSSL